MSEQSARMEYKTLRYKNSVTGRSQAEREVNRATVLGWQLNARDLEKGHFSVGRMLTLSVFFARTKGNIEIVLERQLDAKREKDSPITDAEIAAAQTAAMSKAMYRGARKLFGKAVDAAKRIKS